MTLLFVSFIAGILTVAAPCILPLLPVIIGGSIVRSTDPKAKKQRTWVKPVVIALSLAISVIVFTLLLKATTALLGVPQTVWQTISGIIVILLGVYFLFPVVWEKALGATGLQLASNKLLGKSTTKNGIWGDIAIGASLGPIFSSCSPTYALIVATVLPVSFIEGFGYLAAYAAGIAVSLLLIAFVGQSVVAKLGWLSNPHGNFKKVTGILFIVVGLVVLFGIDRDIQTYVLEQGWYEPISNLEKSFRQ